jgi:hypothetical protein
MQKATMYKRRGRFFLHASSRTTEGVWILTAPCLRFDEDCNDDEIGAGIRTTLNASQTGVAHPRTWTGLVDPLLGLAGVKSWSTLAKAARSVAIEEEGTAVLFIPTRNLGVEHGFEANPASALVVESPNISQLGAFARRAIAASV